MFLTFLGLLSVIKKKNYNFFFHRYILSFFINLTMRFLLKSLFIFSKHSLLYDIFLKLNVFFKNNIQRHWENIHCNYKFTILKII